MKTLLHACRVVAGLEEPETQVTGRELECLLRHAQGAKTIVEIGCFEGSTTIALAQKTSAQVFTIDPFFSGRLGVCYGEVVAKTVRWKLRLKNVHFLKGFSHQIAPQFDKSLDFIFVDADHSYEAIKRDWNDWFPKLGPDGIIALHDCRMAENSPRYLGTMKFYEEDIPKIENVSEVEAIDSLVVFKANHNIC